MKRFFVYFELMENYRLKEVLFDLHVFKRGVFGVLKYYLIQPQYGTTVKTFMQYSVIKENDFNFNGN